MWGWLILWAVFALLVYLITTALYGDMDDAADNSVGQQNDPARLP